MPATQNNRDFKVTSTLGKDVLLFKSMEGVEGLGELFDYRLELYSETHDIKANDILGKMMTISVHQEEDSVERHFSGFVSRFVFKGYENVDKKFSLYAVTLHPWLWFLTQSTDCRIFQNMTPVDIIKKVFSGYSVSVVKDQLQSTYPTLEFCVQYRETDYSFVSRLMEEFGICYYFKHDSTSHELILTDGAYSSVAGLEKIPFLATSKGSDDVIAIRNWSTFGEVCSGKVTLNDYDYEKASNSLSGSLLTKSSIIRKHDHAEYEQYDYPGRYNTADDGDNRSKTRIQSVQSNYQKTRAESNIVGIFPGVTFTLTDHPREDLNAKYLISTGEFKMVAPDYRSGLTTPQEIYYHFNALPESETYRSGKSTPKPFVHGPQTAIVVGSSGDEILTDKYGRIKVQFHWDRVGKNDQDSSCWVRVAQPWAGKNWGSLFIPRVGQEVIVEFLEGDPDRPIVTGAVYNSTNMPPYTLPDNQTQSGFMSNSSKGGGGSNELRLEDKKGSEEIYFHAQKDFNRVVENNDTLKVGFGKQPDKGDQTISICHDRSLDVGNDHAVHIKHDEKIAVDNDQTSHVKHDQTITVDNDQTTNVKNDQKTKVDNTCVVEAQTSIELKVGGSSVKIESGKITLKSSSIEIQGSGLVTIKGGMVQIN